jgi:apolipoprotein N-acyltransferase
MMQGRAGCFVPNVVRVIDRAKAAAPAALAAVLFNQSLAPHDWGWLGWVALTPYFGAIADATFRPLAPGTVEPSLRARWFGPGFGVGFCLGFLFLLLHAPWFGGFSPVGYPVAAAYWGLLFGLGSRIVVCLGRRANPILFPPLMASTWVVMEWLRTQGTLCFPWGTLAASQYRALAVLQTLDLTGAYGLSFLMALLQSALATGFVCRRLQTRPTLLRSAQTWAAAAMVLAIVAAVRGLAVLDRAPRSAPSLRVAVVQSSESYWKPGAAIVCISRYWEYLDWSRVALRDRPDLVVWPECASTDDLAHDPAAVGRAKQLLHGTNTHLLAGSFVVDPASSRTSNAAVLVDPTGRPIDQYSKVQIVPFGEYLPLRPLLSWTEQLGMPREDLLAGKSWTPLTWPAGRIGVSICFESAFGHISRRMVRGGANLLAVLTSDGWAGRSAAGLQHASFAPLRAVECRRSVVRAAATGVSQLIDPYGRPLKTLPMFTKGVIVGEVPLRYDRTLYSELGDWPVGLAWLMIAFAAVDSARNGKSQTPAANVKQEN